MESQNVGVSKIFFTFRKKSMRMLSIYWRHMRRRILFSSPYIYEYSYSLPTQNYKQYYSLPLFIYKQFYSSSAQIYEQGVPLFKISAILRLISFKRGVNLKTNREETLVFGPSFTSFWVVLHWSSPVSKFNLIKSK